jgi:hypothetical protein
MADIPAEQAGLSAEAATWIGVVAELFEGRNKCTPAALTTVIATGTLLIPPQLSQA